VNPALVSFDLGSENSREILSPHFFFPEAEMHSFEVEIGCGKGSFLTQVALKYPGNRYVGLESARAYARFAEDRLIRWKVPNVRILDWAAELVLPFFPSQCVDRFHVYFPDPWPKRRHRPRRVLSAELFRELERALKPEGKVYLGTDFAEYFESTLEGEGSSCFTLERQENHRFFEDAMEPTSYEKKFLKEGRKLYFASFRKKDLR
jgi:tRNA (guanine-N7-)-methyltransferase